MFFINIHVTVNSERMYKILLRKSNGISKTLSMKAGFCAYTRVCDEDIYNYQLFWMPYTQPQRNSKNLILLLTRLCSCCFNSTVGKHTQWKWEACLVFSESFVRRSVNGSIFPGSKRNPFCCLCSQPRTEGPLGIASLLGPATQSLDCFQGAVHFPWKQVCCSIQYYPHPHIRNYHYSQYWTPHYFKYSFGQQKMV